MEMMKSKVDMEAYRYPGPAPRSRETAILMLADGSEARARAELPKDETELRATIKKVIDKCLIEGQLDNSNLTLNDLVKITDSFTSTLMGVYHQRIKYPELKKPGEPTPSRRNRAKLHKRLTTMLQIQIRPYCRNKVTVETVQLAAASTLQECALKDTIVGIIITGDREIHQLNLDYRNIDQPTDVLSFNQNYPDPETGLEYLGDVIISVSRAEKQARVGGHSVDQEIQLLVIHGILHLAGYDHDTEQNQKDMWIMQAKILTTINNPLVVHFQLEKRMIQFLLLRAKSFRNAFSGWWFVISTQKNAWIHMLATAMVIALSLWLQVGSRDWAILFLAIGLVWIAEFLNTALEAVVDLASPLKHPLAKVGKDVGAAAVLIAAFVAVIIGFIILGPPLITKIGMNIK